MFMYGVVNALRFSCSCFCVWFVYLSMVCHLFFSTDSSSSQNWNLKQWLCIFIIYLMPSGFQVCVYVSGLVYVRLFVWFFVFTKLKFKTMIMYMCCVVNSFRFSSPCICVWLGLCSTICLIFPYSHVKLFLFVTIFPLISYIISIFSVFRV